jgi:hypothetical protein
MGNVVRLVGKKNVYRVWLGNLKEINHLEDLIVDGSILEWILKNKMGGRGLDSSGPGYEQVADFCENGNELAGSIKWTEIIG